MENRGIMKNKHTKKVSKKNLAKAKGGKFDLGWISDQYKKI